MDSATTTLKQLSVARVQVEVDILQPRPDKIWIQMGSQEGYWQKVVHENVPSYCHHYWHVGHVEKACHVNRPDLKAIATNPNHPSRKHITHKPENQKRVSVAKTKIQSTISDQPNPKIFDPIILALLPSTLSVSVVPMAPIPLPDDPVLLPHALQVPMPLTTSPDHRDSHVQDFLVSKETGFPPHPVLEADIAEVDKEVTNGT